MTAYFDKMETRRRDALASPDVYDLLAAIEMEVVRDTTLSMSLLRERVPERLRIEVHKAIATWRVMTCPTDLRISDAADRAEDLQEGTALGNLIDQLHTCYHAIGRWFRDELQQGGSYDDPLRAMQDAIDEEEEYRRIHTAALCGPLKS